MDNVKIKILKDTPFNKAGDEIPISEFRLRYSYICTSNVTDKELSNYLYNPPIKLKPWFLTIIKETFELGDWVWHEDLQQAFKVVRFSTYNKTFHPNHATIEGVNSNPNTYKRKATEDEINYYRLHEFCGGDILISKYKPYYFSHIWKELEDFRSNIQMYLKTNLLPIKLKDGFNNNDFGSFQYPCKLNGILVGCMHIPHDEIIRISKILNVQ